MAFNIIFGKLERHVPRLRLFRGQPSQFSFMNLPSIMPIVVSNPINEACLRVQLNLCSSTHQSTESTNRSKGSKRVIRQQTCLSEIFKAGSNIKFDNNIARFS